LANLISFWDDSAADNVKVTLPKAPGETFSLASLKVLGKRRPKIKASVVESNLKSLFSAGSRLALERNGPILLQLATGRPGRPAQRVLFPPKKSSPRIIGRFQGENDTKVGASNVLKFPRKPRDRFTQAENPASPTEEAPRNVANLEDRIELMEERLKALSGMVESMRRTWRETNGFTPVNSELPAI
jgi:hypothetical protein